MSAGAFRSVRYEMDGDLIVPIRVQQETLEFTNGTVANAGATGEVDLSVSARARKGNREYGIGARSVTIGWVGSPPTNYLDENLVIPILTKAAFAAYNVGTTVTYLGVPAVVVGKKSEQLR